MFKNKKINDILATLLGLAVAIANAWANINWEEFVLNKSTIMQLSLSAIIAMGGYFSTLKTLKNGN